MRIGRNRERGLFLLKLIAATAAAVASYGLVARFFGFRQVFVLDDGVDANFLTGTFAGRSSAASYLLIGLATTMALLATRVRDSLRASGPRRNWLLAISDVVETSGVYLLAALVLAAALLNTGSRGGVLAAAVVLPVVAWLSLRGVDVSRKAFAATFAVSAVA